jgi:hypothetical protein
VVKNTDRFPAGARALDTYDTGYLSFMAASMDPDSSADDGSLAWSDVSGGAGLAAGESVSVTLTFLSVKSGSTANWATVEARDQTGAPLTDSEFRYHRVVIHSPQPLRRWSIRMPVAALPARDRRTSQFSLALVMIPLRLSRHHGVGAEEEVSKGQGLCGLKRSSFPGPSRDRA